MMSPHALRTLNCSSDYEEPWTTLDRDKAFCYAGRLTANSASSGGLLRNCPVKTCIMLRHIVRGMVETKRKHVKSIAQRVMISPDSIPLCTSTPRLGPS